MANINIDKETLAGAQNKIIKFLYDSGYEGTLEEGTGIYDLLVKGFALIYTMMEQQTAKTKAYLSIKEAQEIKDQLGDEYDNVIDHILSNWFVERKPATKPRLTVRLFFSRPIEMLQIDPEDPPFREHTPIWDYTFIRSSFYNFIRPNALSERYYVDIEVEPNISGKTSIEVGDILAPRKRISTYFIEAVVTEITDYGTEPETSEELIDRTEEAITTRELITHRAIQTKLKNEFEPILDVYVAGYGYPEQLRDLKKFEAAEVHVGNKADIYITGENRAHLDTRTLEEETSSINLPEDRAITHILRVEKVVDFLNTNIKIPVPHTLLNNGPEHSLGSSRAAFTIIFDDPQPEETTLEIEYLYSPIVPSVQYYVDSREQRVVCYDPLVKSFYPVVLTLNLELQLADEPFDETAFKFDIVNYIKDLRLGTMFTSSKLTTFLHTKHTGIKRIVTPMSIGYSLMDPENLQFYTGSAEDFFSADNISTFGRSLQISSNTTEFYTDISRINIEYV